MVIVMKSVTFFEEFAIIDRIDKLAKEMGTDRSSYIRGAIREKLKREGSNG